MLGFKSFCFFNDISQQELADYLGISKSQMSRIVSGKSNLSIESYQKLINNDRGWNTEFLTDPTWSDLETGRLKEKIASTDGGDADLKEQISAWKKENEMLKEQISELRTERDRYWRIIESLTKK